MFSLLLLIVAAASYSMANGSDCAADSN